MQSTSLNEWSDEIRNMQAQGKADSMTLYWLAFHKRQCINWACEAVCAMASNPPEMLIAENAARQAAFHAEQARYFLNGLVPFNPCKPSAIIHYWKNRDSEEAIQEAFNPFNYVTDCEVTSAMDEHRLAHRP